MMMWEEEFIDELKEQTKSYPIKQLLEVLLTINSFQQTRIDYLRSQIDSVSWSPENWRE